nr:hypothetical protein [Micromonospora sp. DSM 115978]
MTTDLDKSIFKQEQNRYLQIVKIATGREPAGTTSTAVHATARDAEQSSAARRGAPGRLDLGPPYFT